MEFLALPFLSLSLSLSSRNEVKVIYIYFVKIPRSTFRLNYSLIHPLSQLLILPYPTISLISFFIALLLFIRPSLLKTYAFLGICTSSPKKPRIGISSPLPFNLPHSPHKYYSCVYTANSKKKPSLRVPGSNRFLFASSLTWLYTERDPHQRIPVRLYNEILVAPWLRYDHNTTTHTPHVMHHTITLRIHSLLSTTYYPRHGSTKMLKIIFG